VVTNNQFGAAWTRMRSPANSNARSYLRVDITASSSVESYAQKNVQYLARKPSRVGTKKLCRVIKIPRCTVSATANALKSWTAATLVQGDVKTYVNATLTLKFSCSVSIPNESCVARKTTQSSAPRDAEEN